MNPILLTLLLTMVGIALLYLFGGKSRGRNYPRGPDGFPILGHLLFLLGKNPHKTIAEWAKTYGRIFAVDFGNYPAIVISDAELIRTAFKEPDFLGRPAFQHYLDRSGGETSGILFTNGKEWQEQRRFIFRTLRDFNFGSKSMESVVQEEISDLLENLRKAVGKRISTRIRFNNAILNILWRILAGERFKPDEPELQNAMEYFTSNTQSLNKRAWLSIFIPKLIHISPKYSGYAKFLEGMFPILEFLRKPLDFHSASFEEGKSRDFIDAYLEEINKTTEEGSSFYKDKGETSLLFVVYDLLSAGAETTSTTLTWTFLYLAKYPKAQKKLAAEIQAVLGSPPTARPPTLKDRPLMHYTEAVINETLRLSSLTPFGMPHTTTRDVTLEKYTIPKDTLIIPNIYGIHHEEELWGDPDYFRPERFLNRKREFKRNENFLGFSSGKRSCLGEGLAKDQLFLFITSIFQNFKVAPSTSPEELIEEPRVGNIMYPLPHKLVFTLRN